MDEDRIRGEAKESAGTLKKAAGEMTGNPKTGAGSTIEKNVGVAPAAFGRIRDMLRDV